MSAELRARLEAYLVELSDSEHHMPADGCSIWETPDMGVLHCGICTNGARLVARKFGGTVVGYAGGQNPTALAGKVKFLWGDGGTNWGHDFAVVGPFIVDWWLGCWTEDSDRSIFDLQDPADDAEIRRLYGNPELWTSPSSSMQNNHEGAVY